MIFKIITECSRIFNNVLEYARCFLIINNIVITTIHHICYHNVHRVDIYTKGFWVRTFVRQNECNHDGR